NADSLDKPQCREALDDIERRIIAIKSATDADQAFEHARDYIVARWAEEDDSADVRGIRTNYIRKENPMENFSLCRALAAQFDPTVARDAGSEIEIMTDMAKRLGKRSGNRMCIPEGIIFERAVTKGGTGGNLIPTM